MQPGGSTVEVVEPGVPPETLSVLFPSCITADGSARVEGQPDYFRDLNLDQFVAAVTADRQEYELAGFFCRPLLDVATVSYRHEVFADLEDESVFSLVAAFAQGMREARADLAQAKDLRYRYQAESWFVDAVSVYCDAVLALARGLKEVRLHSALTGFRDYLADYAREGEFASLVSRTREVRDALARVHYCVNIRGGRVNVAGYQGELPGNVSRTGRDEPR